MSCSTSELLLVGDVPRLLSIRGEVLSGIGADVTGCTAANVFEFMGREEFALVILCHSLSREIRSALTSVIRQQWPRTRVIEMLLFPDELPLFGCDAHATALANEPERLVELARSLLADSQKGRSAYSWSSPAEVS
jgi:hypothetical protein